MIELVQNLFPLRRDLVSSGYDRALEILSEEVPLEIEEIPSGTQCFDWKVPKKWEVRDAYIEDMSGQRVLDVKDHPLHVASYSNPVDRVISWDELESHLKTYPDRPDLIPYGYCYYDNRWQFCLRHHEKHNLAEDQYRVHIDSSFENGTLKVGEVTVPGKHRETIVLMAHLCHPYQANDDLSGVAVLTEVAKELLKGKRPRYTYQFLYVPETIGSIAYLSQNEDRIDRYRYGIFLEMLGHEDRFSLQYSYDGDTRMDRVAEYVLRQNTDRFRSGAFGEVISNDEKVFNATGIDVPMISLSRSDYLHNGPYREYHSHEDTPELLAEENLREAKRLTLRILEILDQDYVPHQTYRGVPQLSRHELWIEWSDPERREEFKKIVLNALYELDGSRTVFDLAEMFSIDFDFLKNYLDKFKRADLIHSRIPEDSVNND